MIESLVFLRNTETYNRVYTLAIVPTYSTLHQVQFLIKYSQHKNHFINITTASNNLENFSNYTKTTSADKARKLARAFAVEMQNPEFIGVIEVQDNNDPDAGDTKAE
ncbi:hypothetical protein [Sporosarcina thermotolerans]|uniref:hypothetical protein n=1 Tax=Sporosarcina thermotolerans TaxID=633404 RepID=UPI0024BCCDCF|nr:hypothetical protein [Sporosarcina thermotolerans]WHT48294.1 hypothetical protein QNH10_20220 [Sporosarcina thermotolerans]